MAELTPTQRTWKNFKRNNFAVAGLLFIMFCVVVAILGYLIMPDSTPLANNQTIQLSTKKPGASFMMLHIKKTDRVDTVNLFTKMFYGQPAFYRDIPITGYRQSKETVEVNEYIGDEDKPERKVYKLLPSLIAKGPSAYITHKTFLLGTDVYGRDMLSRLILGARISLSVGLMAVIISLFIGITVGAVA